MKPVETYVTVNPKDVAQALTDKNFLTFQGNNLLFVYADYRDVDLFNFLTSVFDIVGKVTVETAKNKYCIVCDKFDAEVVEPFAEYEDISRKMANDIQKISDFIYTCYINKYDI